MACKRRTNWCCSTTSRLLVLIWMLNMSMEWLILILSCILEKTQCLKVFLTSLIVQPGTPGIFCSVTHEKTYRAKASNKEWPIQIRSTLVAKQLLQTLFSASFICFAMKSSTSRPSVKDKFEVAAKKNLDLFHFLQVLKLTFVKCLSWSIQLHAWKDPF